jgi:hypothetical protein
LWELPLAPCLVVINDTASRPGSVHPRPLAPAQRGRRRMQRLALTPSSFSGGSLGAAAPKRERCPRSQPWQRGSRKTRATTSSSQTATAANLHHHNWRNRLWKPALTKAGINYFGPLRPPPHLLHPPRLQRLDRQRNRRTRRPHRSWLQRPHLPTHARRRPANAAASRSKKQSPAHGTRQPQHKPHNSTCCAHERVSRKR